MEYGLDASLLPFFIRFGTILRSMIRHLKFVHALAMGGSNERAVNTDCIYLFWRDMHCF